MDEPIQFYANAVNLATGLYDITLQFRIQAPIGPIEPGVEPMIETVSICNVRMSPQHAKALAGLLVSNVLGYEKQFKVELPLPPDIEELWQKFVKED